MVIDRLLRARDKAIAISKSISFTSHPKSNLLVIPCSVHFKSAPVRSQMLKAAVLVLVALPTSTAVDV